MISSRDLTLKMNHDVAYFIIVFALSSLLADITAAAKSDYGASGDYMYDLAKVHIVVRDW